MNLHYHFVPAPNIHVPNPAWDDGVALEAIWKEMLKELPEGGCCKNPILEIVLQEMDPLDVTYTASTTLSTLYGTHSVPPQQPPETHVLHKQSLATTSSLNTDDTADSADQNPKRQ